MQRVRNLPTFCWNVLHWSLFHTAYAGRTIIQNFCMFLPDYEVSHDSKQNSLSSLGTSWLCVDPPRQMLGHYRKLGYNYTHPHPLHSDHPMIGCYTELKHCLKNYK